MESSVQTGKRRVNYRRLSEGITLPSEVLCKRYSITPKREVLASTYNVERIICTKSTSEGPLYLVKWESYHANDATWETKHHLSQSMVEAYNCPPISHDRLQVAAEVFERVVVQQRLTSKNAKVSVPFPLDIYRNVFGTDQPTVVNNEQQLENLPLCQNWCYKIDKHGKGLQVYFPMSVTPHCFMRPVYVRENNQFTKKNLPM